MHPDKSGRRRYNYVAATFVLRARRHLKLEMTTCRQSMLAHSCVCVLVLAVINGADNTIGNVLIDVYYKATAIKSRACLSVLS